MSTSSHGWMLSPRPAPFCPASLPPQARAQWALPLWLWVSRALSQQYTQLWPLCTTSLSLTQHQRGQSRQRPPRHCPGAGGEGDGGRGFRGRFCVCVCVCVCRWEAGWDPGALKGRHARHTLPWPPASTQPLAPSGLLPSAWPPPLTGGTDFHPVPLGMLRNSRQGSWC